MTLLKEVVSCFRAVSPCGQLLGNSVKPTGAKLHIQNSSKGFRLQDLAVCDQIAGLCWVPGRQQQG